jgi:hypothetical protein
VALGSQGDTLGGAEITWASSNPQVATVDALTGVARGLVAGRALILATSGNRSSIAELTVLPNALAALQVLGARPMAVQETLGLRVVARDPAGDEITGVPITWTSSDSGVAAVEEGTGLVVGVAPGSATITATAEDVSARVRLNVLPRPQPLRPQAGAADRAADWVVIGLDECYGAVQSQNVYRLRTLWQPQSATDEENLKGLTRILSSSGWAVTVGQRVDRPPVIGPEAATMDFTVPLTWREPDKGTRAVQLPFRAEFVRAAGRWEMSSCRIVGAARF